MALHATGTVWELLGSNQSCCLCFQCCSFPSPPEQRKGHCLLKARSWWKEEQGRFLWSHVQREAMLCRLSRGTQQAGEVGPWESPHEVQQGQVQGAAGPEKVAPFFMSHLESKESGERESVT